MTARLNVPAISQQVPEFVRSEYPVFVEFLQAYYQWLSGQKRGRYEDLVDIDQTVDEYIQYFRKQLDVYGITANTDEKLLLKNIKQLYSAKGSNQSFEFFFKILFQKQSNIIEPWEFVFKPSAGQWQQDVSLVVTANQEDTVKLSGAAVILTDSSGNTYKTIVVNALRKRNGQVELFVKRSLLPRDIVSVRIENNGQQSFNVIRSTIGYVVESAGAGFVVGQVFIAPSPTGENTIFKVKSVNSSGGITAIDIITFGSGYQTDFNLQFSPREAIDVSDFGAYIELNNLRYPSQDNTITADSGTMAQHDYTLITSNSDDSFFADMTYVGRTVGSITPAPADRDSSISFANVRFRVGGLRVYPGYYITSENILGDAVYIHDSYYYQVYSYVTEVSETIDKYADILKKVLHPTGAIHFARYAINNRFLLDPRVFPELNIISKGDATRDIVTVTDLLATIQVVKSVVEVVSVTDDIEILTFFNRVFDDFVVVVDTVEKDFDKPLFDDLLMTEFVEKELAKPASDSITIIDEHFSSVDKYEDAPILIQTGTSGLYMEPYYVEPLPPFWEAGYLDNEREIT